MKIEKGKSKQVADDLKEIIRNKHSSFIRNANTELILLFWQIGLTINANPDHQAQDTHKKPATRSLATELAMRYGRFFMKKNLAKISLFAKLYPDLQIVRQFIYYTDWDHILFLLSIKDGKARHFYLHHKIMKASNLLKDEIMQNVFKAPLLSSFRQLTAPSKAVQVMTRNKKNDTREKLLEKISGLIEKYRSRQNRWFNAQLNILFWEIGRRINQEYRKNKTDSQKDSLIRDISRQLVKKYGTCFKVTQLRAMAKFAIVLDEIGIASWIAHLVSWKHILVLLTLKEKNEIIFYTRLTAMKNLSEARLQKEIIKKRYDKVPGSEKIDPILLHAIQNPVQKTTTQRTAKAIYQATTVDYEFADINNSKLQINVFKNPYFERFVSVNQ